jgi:hypothetical protein
MLRFALFLIAALITFTVTLVQAQAQPCPTDFAGYLPPRLQVGGRGRVESGGSANRIRSLPTTQAEQIGTLEPGAEFDVVEGPSCDSAAMIIWWRVQSGDINGWTAEGLLPDDYFVEPLATPTPVWTFTPSRTPPPTLTPTATYTPLPLEPLPELETLSPENISELEVLARFHMANPHVPLFTSPTGEYLFIPQDNAYGTDTAVVYHLPDFTIQSQMPPVDFRDSYYTESNHSAIFTSDGALMASVFNQDRITFYQPREDHLIPEETLDGAFDTFDLSEKGILAVGNREYDNDSGQFSYWLHFVDPLRAADQVLSIPLTAPVYAVTFIHEGAKLLAAGENRLTLYDGATGEVLRSFNYGMLKTGAMAVLPGTGEALPTVFLSQQDYVLSVDLETGMQRSYPVGISYIATRLEISPDGKTLLALADSPTLYADAIFIDIATKAVVYQETLVPPMTSVEYHPSSTLAHIGFRFFHTTTWQEIYRLGANYGKIRFSADGKLVLALDYDTRKYHLLGVPAR